MKVEYDDIVVIKKGFHKRKIGTYDDDVDGKKAVIYYGDSILSMLINKYHYEIPKSYLSIATISDLMTRREEITKKLFRANENDNDDDKKTIELLLEHNLISTTLYERDREMKYVKHKEGSKRIFIAHSSNDKIFARRITNDLKNIYGLDPWFDEIKIKAGESIPQKIQDGIHNCDYMLVLLSKDSIKSNWMKTEYSSKLWDEVEQQKVYVIPILVNECEIPQLLKHKKYISFINQDYSESLSDIVDSI